MREQDIIELLKAVKEDKIPISDAINKLRHLPFEDLEFVKIDNHREIRTGYPEVIYCEGKSIPQIKGIIRKMFENKNNILGTRVNKEVYDSLKEEINNIEYYPEARIIFVQNNEIKHSKHKILVVTGGTSDIPVAEEAAITAEKMGSSVERLFDVGVAGIHRILHNLKKLDEASVIIVVAGMEGALASVVGGLVDKPVIAVPTSIGYGASFGGIAALLAMLNSCASGVSVQNIDNGFGAGFFASLIIRQIEKSKD
jgi:pyridinium-3,5-biscarboxylic acid mononucleotide synthase